MKTTNVSLLVALLVATTPVVARAQPSQQADAHFRHGVELYKEADYTAALVEFQRAYEIDPRFQALYNIAETFYQLQDYASALKTFERYLADGGTKLTKERRDEVTSEITKLRMRVGTIDIRCDTPGVEIAIDDAPIGKTPIVEPQLVSVGRRRVVATRAGHAPFVRVVELAGGDRRIVKLDLPEEPIAQTSSGVPVAPWIATGVLAAGAVVCGVLALDASNDLKSKIGVYPGADPDAINSARSKTLGLALATDALAGAAIVVGGISIYVTASSRSKAPTNASRVTLGVGPGSLRLRGSF